MRTYIKIAGETYPASISGNLRDSAWGGRASKTIRLAMSHTRAANRFVDGVAWSIIEVPDEGESQEYDNSEYCVAGDIIDHRDGTVSVKMGKLTEFEQYMRNAISTDEYDEAYREGVDSLD